MSECKHNWLFYTPKVMCTICEEWRDTEYTFDEGQKRIKALEGVVHWLAMMVTDGDDMLLSELCICFNDYPVGISMQCPICSENSPLYKAIEDARKKLEEV